VAGQIAEARPEKSGVNTVKQKSEKEEKKAPSTHIATQAHPPHKTPSLRSGVEKRVEEVRRPSAAEENW